MTIPVQTNEFTAFWQLSAEETAELALDEIAYRILVLLDTSASGHFLHQDHLWGNNARRTWAARPDAGDAIDEGWQFLFNRGLVLVTSTSNRELRITRAGRTVLDEGMARASAAARLEHDLRPELADARSQFLRGKYDTAVFEAMRAVEVAVRTKAQLPAATVGVTLMSEAYKAGGPLRDPSAVAGEADALLALLRGAIGLYKNPSSHRYVSFTDPSEVAEIVILANLLLRTIAK